LIDERDGIVKATFVSCQESKRGPSLWMQNSICGTGGLSDARLVGF